MRDLVGWEEIKESKREENKREDSKRRKLSKREKLL